MNRPSWIVSTEDGLLAVNFKNWQTQYNEFNLKPGAPGFPLRVDMNHTGPVYERAQHFQTVWYSNLTIFAVPVVAPTTWIAQQVSFTKEKTPTVHFVESAVNSKDVISYYFQMIAAAMCVENYVRIGKEVATQIYEKTCQQAEAYNSRFAEIMRDIQSEVSEKIATDSLDFDDYTRNLTLRIAKLLYYNTCNTIILLENAIFQIYDFGSVDWRKQFRFTGITSTPSQKISHQIYIDNDNIILSHLKNINETGGFKNIPSDLIDKFNEAIYSPVDFGISASHVIIWLLTSIERSK